MMQMCAMNDEWSESQIDNSQYDNAATRQTMCVVCIGAGAGECVLVPIGLTVVVSTCGCVNTAADVWEEYG